MDISNILNDNFKNKCFSFFRKLSFIYFFVHSSLIKQFPLSKMIEKKQFAKVETLVPIIILVLKDKNGIH